MSMGGKGPEVLVTLTTDFGKILEGLHRTKIRGCTHLTTGIQVAGVSQTFHQFAPRRFLVAGLMLGCDVGAN
jgi:26S proteasome regulatory subunit N10